jgi:uncharacterized protein DUF1653
MVRPGRYRHYKGKEYEVIGRARHSETEEEYVVYRALYGDHGLWIRPIARFAQPVTVDGRVMPRFASIEEKVRLGAPGAGGCVAEEARLGATGVGGCNIEEVRPRGKGRVLARPGRAGMTSPGAGECDGEEVRLDAPGVGGCDDEGSAR